jgi:hypothetical protein
MHVSDKKQYDSLMGKVKSKCTRTYPCPVWATGQLKYDEFDSEVWSYKLKVRVVYVELDDVRVYDGHNNRLIAAAGLAAETLEKIRPYLQLIKK